MEVAKLFALLLFFIFAIVHCANAKTKNYIVYMGHHSHPNSGSVITANHETLASVVGSYDGAQEATLHHYTKSFRGFSAMLTPDQAQKLAESNSVVSVFESGMNEIHTTRSWSFLGVDYIHQYNHQLSMDTKSDVIVGVIDTGIWPESKSFNDYGLGPVPKKFKGECVTGQNFTLSNCNRKIIGARFYSKGFEAEFGDPQSFNLTFYRSARDTEGHGTHAASTVAGSRVANTSLFGVIARGTARGGAPSARLAIYKACWYNLCSDADILSAMDDAINDGVDIISLSFGQLPPQRSYFQDVNSIGAFHAFEKGILVSASAGNNFFPSTAVNVAPWIFTVGASNIDRELQSNIYLGNSKIVKGFGLNPLKMKSYYGLMDGNFAAAPGIPQKNASFCKNNTLDATLIKGKIVLCTIETTQDDPLEKARFVRQGGGVGMILVHPVGKDACLHYVIPTTVISQAEAEELLAYMAMAKNPVAKILATKTVLFTKPAPQVTMFSARGPNIITPDIIKPDIVAPGANILAAWSPVATRITAGQFLDYNIISGTSMSCPHVSAVAAIIKSYHPSWSPAAIKSAIMTTAMIQDNTQNFIETNPDGTRSTPFDYGSGQINPFAAVNPGLVYDYDSNDVIDLLCSTGATSAQLKNLTGQLTYCKNRPIPPYNFNYPSIGVSKMKGKLSVHRTVTYYGEGPTVYRAQLEYPSNVNISVIPNKLNFTKTGEKISFRVNFTPYKSSNGSFVFGALTWSNGIHRVRSPIGLNVLSI